MTHATPQEIYSAAQELEAASPLTRAMMFTGLGGEFFPAEPQPAAVGEHTWTVRLFGLTGEANCESGAIANWIKAAKAHPFATGTARATDGRPDCPYNGSGLPPTASATAAGAT